MVTGAVYSRQWKVEGSVFNGREPDENRWGIDLEGRRLDSFAGRLTLTPGGRLAVSSWYGYLASPESRHPDEPVRRYGASILHHGRGVRGGDWATTLLWGANRAHGQVRHSALAETSLQFGTRTSVFGRAEAVRKSAGDLVVTGLPDDTNVDVRSLVFGAVREIASPGGTTLGLGVRASLNFVPVTLAPAYGTRTPTGVAVYVRIRPSPMSMPTGHEMHQGSSAGNSISPRP